MVATGDSKPADEPIVFTTRTVESLGSTDNAAKSQPLRYVSIDALRVCAADLSR